MGVPDTLFDDFDYTTGGPFAPHRPARPVDPITVPPAAGTENVSGGRLIVASDGSALGNPGPGGWGWYIDDDRWASGGVEHTTNNIMELHAVLDLLQSIDRDVALNVRTDSQYVIQALTEWIKGWRRRGWKTAAGKPVANQELIQAIDAELSGRDVTFTWVKGHSGDPMNERADDLARSAATDARDGRPHRASA